MRIVHFSDWHGGQQLLPKADLYVMTGDMLPNFPILKFRHWDRKLCQNREFEWDPNGPQIDPTIPKRPKPPGDCISRLMEQSRERRLQELWMAKVGSYRSLLASPDAPVVCVKGNHDFVPIAPLFGGDVWEVDDDPTRTTVVCGLKVGGMRGVRPISGEWADETPEEELDDRARSVPDDVELLITHAPPRGVMDDGWGTPSLTQRSNVQLYNNGKLKLHCFGHVHECKGTQSMGHILFSNAATGVNVIDI